MKRFFVIGIILLLTLSVLCSCSLFHIGDDTSTQSDDTSSEIAQEKLISLINGNINLDELSLDELLKLYDDFLEGGDALNDGAENDLLYRNVEIKPNDASAEIGFEYPTYAQVASYSDKEWEDKTVETLDPTVNMSPEEKAEYEAAIKGLEDFDADEFQKSIDEMLKGIEGFEDYNPDNQETGDNPSILNEWPDNDITKQVPKPPFANPMIVADDDSITVMQISSNLEEAKSYAKQLKNSGFDIDVSENTNEVAGYSIYTFTAVNHKGLSVSLTFASGTTTVNFSKD